MIHTFLKLKLLKLTLLVDFGAGVLATIIAKEMRNFAESRTSVELKLFVKENFRLSGDMVVKHVFTKKGELND